MTETPGLRASISIDPRSPTLLNDIDKILLAPKIRGEQTNRKLLFIICLSTFTHHPLSAIVKGRSAAGKSRLVNTVLDLFRKMGIVIEFSRITGAYLENMAKAKSSVPKPVMRKEVSREEYEDQLKLWREQPRRVDLTGKIIFVDELRGIQNAQSPKLLISEGRLRLGTVIDGQPVEIEVVGTPVIITTTTLAALEDPEFENRVIPLQVDESDDQTKGILEFEADGYEDPSGDPMAEKRFAAIIELLQKLQPRDVAIPYAKQIADAYPVQVLEARRDYPKLMSLVSIIAWLHQHQRVRARNQKMLSVVVVAEPQDFEKAKKLALPSLRESLSGVSVKENVILEALQENQCVDSFGNKIGPYNYMTLKEILAKTKRGFRRGKSWAREHVTRLVEEGYVEEDPSNGKGKENKYCYSGRQPEGLEFAITPVDIQTWALKKGYTLVDESQQVGLTGNSSPLTPAEPANLAYLENAKLSAPSNQTEPDLGLRATSSFSFKDAPRNVVADNRVDPILAEAARLTRERGQARIDELAQLFPDITIEEVASRMYEHAKAEKARTLDWGVWRVPE
jgi:hypothetical protein